MFSCLCSCNCNFSMNIIRSADIHNINLRIIYNIMPICRIRFKSKLIFSFFGNCFIHINDHLFDRNDWCRPEKHRHTSICNGMSFSHKSCTNQTDIHFFRTCIILIHFYSPFRPAAKSTNEIS